VISRGVFKTGEEDVGNTELTEPKNDEL